MILTAHQPTYLPWLGLFHKIALSDKFVSFNEVQYLPKDWMNRNKIKTNNDPIWLSVPVLRKGYRDSKISELLIDNKTNWKEKHLKSIIFNYKKSRYFEKYVEFFEDTYSRKWEYLDELNEHMLKWFLDELDINVEFIRASDFDFQGTKSSLVLDMCKKLKADKYIFGELGKEYAEIEEFKKSNIEVIFQEYVHPTYKQLNGDFISHLSIIDLLFNCGPDSFKILMSNNISKSQL